MTKFSKFASSKIRFSLNLKIHKKIFLLKPRTFFWFCFPLNQLKQKMGAKLPYSVEVNSSQTKYQMDFKPETYKIYSPLLLVDSEFRTYVLAYI